MYLLALVDGGGPGGYHDFFIETMRPESQKHEKSVELSFYWCFNYGKQNLPLVTWPQV